MADMTAKQELKQLYKKTAFTIDLFKQQAHFTQDYEEMTTLLSPLGITIPLGAVGRCVYAENQEDGAVIFYIGVFDNQVSTLIHEVTHCALYLLKCVGQKLDYEDELLPYLIQDIFEKCYCKLNLDNV